jgi:tetratricopeptide (TPR) repeat protein
VDKDNSAELDAIWDEARNQIQSGYQEKAIEIYKDIMLRYAVDPVACEYANAYLSEIYVGLKQFDLAEKHIKKAISYQPEKSVYHYMLGFLFSYRQEWNQAVSEFAMAVAGEPQNAECLRGLGRATYQSGNRVKGLELLHQANKLAPGNVNILTDLAVANLALDFKESRKYAEQAVAIDPDNSLAQQVLDKIQVAEEDIRWIVKNSRLGWDRVLKANCTKTGIYQYKISLNDNPAIWRIIEIKENQFLSSLHKGIMLAFDRREERTYSFYFSQKKGDRQHEFASSVPGTSGTAQLAKSIRIDSIPLYQDKDEIFLYLFDYENKCWHEVELIQRLEKIPRAVYPRVVKRHGKFPEKRRNQA